MVGLIDTLWYAMYVVGFRGLNITAFWIQHRARVYPGDAVFLGAWHRATYR